MSMEKDNRMMLRELLQRTEEQKQVEDAYSANYMEDPYDDDILTGAEQGFMQGYIS